MTASHLLALCFVLTVYGTDLGATPICSAPESTNVFVYQTTQSTKAAGDLTGFTGRPVSPGRPRNNPQGDLTPRVRLATTPTFATTVHRSIDVQRNPGLCTDRADPTPNICSAEDESESVLIRNEMIHPAGHGADTSGIEDFMKRLLTDGPKKNEKPRK
jgi:hypothetical protein